MLEYIIVTTLGLLLYWAMEISRAYRKTKKYNNSFYWSRFIEENIFNFFICVVSSIIIFYLIDINTLKMTRFPYITFIRMDTFIFLSSGMMGSYIVNQLMKFAEYFFKFKKE